jgi:hypothetical protein
MRADKPALRSLGKSTDFSIKNFVKKKDSLANPMLLGTTNRKETLLDENETQKNNENDNSPSKL